ncbi:hypothetical protein [Aurantibacillus circumpalustris]|uniref:hypothetical protein n=1 Tax=Aurantibacillus circumpalustris TaxID=3036359 RepID=UPI00295AC0C4|nr:hypothetical protein [Aurantibacillus circumpalustris]
MKKLLFFNSVVLITFLGCSKDFIVEDISKKSLVINAPANNTATTLNQITFWWDELDGAEKYNLQIVKPDFTNTIQLMLDTNITVNKFNYTFKPGSYQWRVKATNAGHSTTFQVFSIKIDTTSDLSEQSVGLLSPANGAVTGNTLVTFNWSPISVAKKYRLQINSGLVLDTTFTAKTSLTFTVPAIKNSNTPFTWNVKAINDASESQFNPASNTFTVDLKGPSVPVLSAPNDGTIVTVSDTLKWNHGSDAKYDTVYVADDSLFLSVTALWIDLNRIAISEFGRPVGATYWWRVRSFDTYGNPSSYSLTRKFKIQQ